MATAEDIPHPRETDVLFGHADAERAMLDAYKSGKLAHAWLIGGAPGIGKATLAYRFARFVLANPEAAMPAVQRASSLQVDPDHPVARRIASQSHSDLLGLERVVNEETGKLFTVIRVQDVRRSVSFFGSTAGEGGWRVCIVDTADELQQPHAANALLKILEEPPPRSLLLLVSNAPGQILATIRSRSRRLMLRPLATADVGKAAAVALGRPTEDPEIAQAAAASGGSAARALALIEGGGLALRTTVLGLLEKLPALDPRALHGLGEALAGTDPRPLEAFVDAVNGWLSSRLAVDAAEPRRLARVAEAFARINAAVSEADEYNLDRKPLVFAVFDELVAAARG